ncbi:MAG: glycosyltransferase family protein [Candidatus Omnitrophota bacterium]|nr:glycosyltransferase family protein [Candidatus Omnitrophota bacterium]
MKKSIFVQARMGSSRLPGKVMADLFGRPLLERLVERLRRSTSADQVVVLTSSAEADQAIEDLAYAMDVPVFRGDEDDVLDRYFQAAKKFQPDAIIRVTGDCPLIDPRVIDQVASFFETEDRDYVSNILIPTFPDGLDVEIFRIEALESCWRNAREKYQREHVTSYFYENPDLFRLANFRSPVDRSAMRWLVDEAPDLVFVRKVYERLYPDNATFLYADILALLDREPELQTLNAHLRRNEGFFKSKDGASAHAAEDARSGWARYIQEIMQKKGCELYESVG